MMRVLTATLTVGMWGCGGNPEPYDLDFDIPRTEAFAERLSDYGLYEGTASNLVPAGGVHVYELSSELFTDYAHKQRLLKVPTGTSISIRADDTLDFPEGTVLAKTFHYPDDMRDPASASRIIETRLLVKTDGVWNTATYVWNDAQTDATVLLDGTTTPISWTDGGGATRTIEYGIPSEGECVTCHQSDGATVFIGPTATNLNRPVVRDGVETNQLAHLASQGVLGGGNLATLPTFPDYRDPSLSLEERTRAYLDINCAHCHNPGGWDEATERELDFRYSTPLDRTGIERKADEFPRLLEDGVMPFLGVTLPHTEGIELLTAYASTIEGGSRQPVR